MKWILLIIGIGVLSGAIFPDYRFSPNIIIIPFGVPLFIAALSTYLGLSKRLSRLSSSIWGLLSLYLSNIVGVLVYGYSVGWQYVTDDTETQAVIMATIGIQTITYLIGVGISTLLLKRYNKAFKRDSRKDAASPLT